MRRPDVYISGIGKSGTSAVVQFLHANGWNIPENHTTSSRVAGLPTYLKLEPCDMVSFITSEQGIDKEKFHAFFDEQTPCVYKVPDKGIEFAKYIPDNVVPLFIIRHPEKQIASRIKRTGTKQETAEKEYRKKMTAMRYLSAQYDIKVIDFNADVERTLADLFGIDDPVSAIDFSQSWAQRNPLKVPEDLITLYESLL